GRGAVARAGRGAGAVLGDDGAEPVLHERRGSEAQGARDRGGGGGGASELRAEAAPERGGADDCVDGQGSDDGQARDAHLPGGGPGDDLPDDDGDRGGRGALEPVPGAG